MRPIDGDALKEKIDNIWNGRPLSFLGARILAMIDNAPTISADRPQEWIPCSERLPSNFSEDETVLVTTDVDGDRVIAMFALDVKSFYLKGYVVAWMPLPKPYREDKQ